MVILHPFNDDSDCLCLKSPAIKYRLLIVDYWDWFWIFTLTRRRKSSKYLEERDEQKLESDWTFKGLNRVVSRLFHFKLSGKKVKLKTRNETMAKKDRGGWFTGRWLCFFILINDWSRLTVALISRADQSLVDWSSWITLRLMLFNI